jgi:hypothetical protein
MESDIILDGTTRTEQHDAPKPSVDGA